MSAPASAASAAATIPTPASKGDHVLSIVEAMNRQFTRWIGIRYDRKNSTPDTLPLEADVTGLSDADRARLRHLLKCHGFDVVPGTTGSRSHDGHELMMLVRDATSVDAKEQEETEEDKDEENGHTECSKCKAPATPDFIKLPGCGHIFCPKCTLYMTLSPDCRCCEGCITCYKKFFFEDMEYLDGSLFDSNPPPSKRQKIDTDQAKAAAASE